MYKKINSRPDIFAINVPLPNNPLRELNCYVVKTRDKNLIIDTGFNMPQCYKALSEGLNELKINIDKTDLFLTHLHADHTGLASSIMKKDSTIYMSKPDYDYIARNLSRKYWESMDACYLKEGFDEKELKSVRKVNPSKIFNIKKMFDAVIVDDNFKFNVGEYEFTCIATSGHTPGHMCLYMENEKILFSGDHILFDITPNITRWKGVKNSLADYLNSLKKIKEFDIRITLPAHRGNKNNEDVYERIEQIIHHHKERLEEAVYIVESNPGINAYDVAGKMKWSMHGKSWDEAPVQQKWFAVGETLAHLDYLELESKVYKELKNNIYRYYV